MELLYFKEDEILDENLKTVMGIVNKKEFTHTNSQAVYRISPVVICEKSKELIYPKVKVVEEDLKAYEKNKVNLKEDEKNIKHKFDVKENVFGKEVNVREATESNFIEVVDPAYDGEEHDHVDGEIKKPEDEEDQSKHLDKFNLLKAFRFVNDPFNLKTEFTYDEDYHNTELNFEAVDKRIENLFGIN